MIKINSKPALLFLLGGGFLAIVVVAGLFSSSEYQASGGLHVGRNIAAAHEIHNAYGEGIALACHDGNPAVAFLFDGRLRTRRGERIFIEIDNRRTDDKYSRSKRLQIWLPVYLSGDESGAVVLRAKKQDAIKILKFIARSARVHFEIDERHGFQIKSRFLLTRDDQLGAEKVLKTCPMKPAKATGAK